METKDDFLDGLDDGSLDGQPNREWAKHEAVLKANRQRLVAPEKLGDYHLGVVKRRVWTLLHNGYTPFGADDATHEHNYPLIYEGKLIGSVYVNDNFFVPRLGYEPREVVLLTLNGYSWAFGFTYDEFATFMTTHGFRNLADPSLAKWVHKRSLVPNPNALYQPRQ
jgi:hypothetical protein